MLRLIRGVGLRSYSSTAKPTSLCRNFFTPASAAPRPSTLNYSRSFNRQFSRNYGGSSSHYANYNANMRIIYGLIGVNVAIFGYGTYARTLAMQGFQEKMYNFYKNMTLNLNDVVKRPWTVLTHAFTHVQIGHLFVNMLSLYFIGQILAAAPMITPARFLVVVFGAATTGALGHLSVRAWKLQSEGRSVDRTRGLGFSGANMGIMTLAACLNPTTKILIYGIVPVPLWLLAVGYAVYSGYSLGPSGSSGISHGGHMGGLVFGAVYYLAKIRGLRF